MPDNPRLKNTRSKDFRYIYTNGIGTQISQHGETTLIFGLKEDPNQAEDILLEEVAVIMTLQTMKVLALTLTKVVESIERASGVNIIYDEAKMAAISKAIESSFPTLSATASQPPS